ncbi:MAG: DNA polymerase/3'-5' exonuclease PolX [Actinomycetota bacterium]|nr:DNA polymerase/3'-5' exonuclease PolX [Actinomycetota bacterium]
MKNHSDIKNRDIARIFDEVADLLEISGESFFRVRAYRNASRVIRDLSTPLSTIARSQNAKLEDLPGIGKDLAEKIQTIVETGDLPLRRELESELPVGLLEVMRIPGLGPRKAHRLFLELGITDPERLEEAARCGKIRELKGFGEKTEAQILEGIETLRSFGKRMLRADVEPIALSIIEHMKRLKGLEKIEIAGSYRRLKETVGDLDILVACRDPAGAMDHFVSFPGVRKTIAKGKTKSSVVTNPEIQVDLRVVGAESFGAALQYFTGSKAHGIAMRTIAQKKGLKLNEYGVFKGEKMIAGRTEREVYEAAGLPWIPPELRENRGEIEAALEGTLPELISLSSIRGDLHMHTDETDGRDSLETMASEAKKRGYLYIAVTNHTKRVAMAGGLDEQRLLKHWDAVEKLNAQIEGFHILKGVEVDILDDGTLDIEDAVLSKGDYVVASVHYNTNMSRSQMTRRIVRALSNPNVSALAHPTGRLINKRPPYEVDMEVIIATCAKFGVALELNAAPDRLDIDDTSCRSARQHGVKVSIATDAHNKGGLDFMRYGVYQARRGWLEKEDVINTLNFRLLNRFLKKRG